jgi:hypothetical protein
MAKKKGREKEEKGKRREKEEKEEREERRGAHSLAAADKPRIGTHCTNCGTTTQRLPWNLPASDEPAFRLLQEALNRAS